MSLDEENRRGQKVRLVGAEIGYIKGKDNTGFPLWEINLQSGKTVTEARYRFDILEESVVTPPPVHDVLIPLFVTEPDDDDDFVNPPMLLPLSPQPSTSRNSNPTTSKNICNPGSIPKEKNQRVFVSVIEESIDQFIENQKNLGTARKNNSDMKSLNQFLKEKNEVCSIHRIPPNELNILLSRFFISVRKTDGEEYEPSSLRGMFCSFNRILRKHNYGVDLSKNEVFAKTRDVLIAKQIELKKMGKGNAEKKAEALTDEDVDKMFESGQLGLSNPTSLLHSLWFFNTIYFGLPGVTEHYQMKWGDVKLCKDAKNREYLEMTERNTKTRTGINVKNVREIPQRAWTYTEDPSRCPVEAYKIYRHYRPLNFNNKDDPFYIQENNNLDKSQKWYKAQRVGVNKLGKFMKTIAAKSGMVQDCTAGQDNTSDLEDDDSSKGKRHLTNHSARRFLIQKLDDVGVENNPIKQISGHRNIQSISTYSKLNQSKHHDISRSILDKRQENVEDDYNIQSSQTLRTVTVKNNGQHKCIEKTETQSLSASQNLHERKTGFQYVFGAPIYGGTFHINLNTSQQPDPILLKRKRPRVIDSDSSQD